MAEDQTPEDARQSIDTGSARQLATTTKTAPQMTGVTPRWILKLLPWVQVDSGTYRVNRRRVVLREGGRVQATLTNGKATLDAEQLRAVPLFSEVKDEVLADVAGRFKSEQHGPGDIVFKEGDPGDKFYILARGKVEIFTTGHHGETVRLAFLSDGAYFGEIALLSGDARNATVKSLVPSVLLALPRKDFQALLDKSPDCRERLETAMQERNLARHAAEESGEEAIDIGAGHKGESELPQTYVGYEDEPHEYPLSVVQTVLRVHTRVSDIYNQPHSQLREQTRLSIEGMKEKQEWEVINNPDFGLLHAAESNMRIPTRGGPPTPDDMDELLSKVWKKPAFFLAHPRAIAAFGRECTRRGVPPPTLQMYGSPFITWRGVPLVPSNKLEIAGATGHTNILLMRVGEENQGVVGLHQAGIPGEQLPSLSVRFMGINEKAVASYLLTLYHSAAVLTDDALGVLENVAVGSYHDYA